MTALLALMEQTRELTNEVRVLREQRDSAASQVTHRWWKRGGRS
jgi:uncharacterized coiled-coil DUF342 family protein